MSAQYTHGHPTSVLQAHARRTAADSAGYLLPQLHAGMRVLDVGCGPGSITVDLAESVGPGGSVTGLEVVAEPLGRARALAAERGVEIDWLLGDVSALDFPDDSFDVVHAHQVLQHLGDPAGALREMRRVARPGGLVAVRDADYAGMIWHPPSAALDRWLSLYRATARLNGGEPDAGRRMRLWARAAGFADTDLEITGSVWTYADPAGVTWWSRSWAQRVTSSAFAQQSVAHGLTDTGELAELAEGWLTWGRDPDAFFQIPHTEVIARV